MRVRDLMFVDVYSLNCSSILHKLPFPGASHESLSLWPFSLYYCVKLMLSVNIEIWVVCSSFLFDVCISLL